MDSEGEEVLNEVGMVEGQKLMVRKTDVDEFHMSGREEMNYSGDTQGRGKGRTESGHHLL